MLLSLLCHIVLLCCLVYSVTLSSCAASHFALLCCLVYTLQHSSPLLLSMLTRTLSPVIMHTTLSHIVLCLYFLALCPSAGCSLAHFPLVLAHSLLTLCYARCAHCSLSLLCYSHCSLLSAHSLLSLWYVALWYLLTPACSLVHCPFLLDHSLLTLCSLSGT